MSPSRRSRRIDTRNSSGPRLLGWCAILLVVAGGHLPHARADEELEYGLAERRVRALDFTGVEFFEEDRLESVLGLGDPPWYAPFRARSYRRDRLDQGIEMMRGMYRRNGFHRVRVALRVVEQDDTRGDVLAIEVQEGRRTIIDHIEIVDPEPLTEEEVLRLLRYRSGGPAPARAADLGGDIYRILDAYVARGHLSARVREDVTPGDSTVTVRYTISAGPAYRVREVNVVGNERVLRPNILRELRLREGDRFDASRIERTEIALLDTGWFRDVGFQTTDLDSANATASLQVRVVERPNGFWELGLGSGSKDRVRLTAAWGDRNLWRSGKGVTLRGRLLGVIDGSVEDPDVNELFIDHEEELLYRHPHLLGSRYTVNSNFFFRTESRPRSALELQRTGLLVNTTVLSRRSSIAEIEVGLQRTRKLSLSDAFTFDNDRERTRSLTLVISRDTRDDFFQPRRGDLRQVLLQTAGGPLLRGDNSFHKALASVVRLVPLSRQAVLATRVQAGWIEAWWESADRSGRVGGVPIEDRFFAGGSSSVRGYRENSLGPRLREDDEALQEVQDPRFLTDRISAGGNALLLFNTELRVPLPLLSRLGFDATVFFDAGNVWASWKDFQVEQLWASGDVVGPEAETAFRSSWGVGLHYRTVVGPLRLDYGIPLRRATYLRVIDESTGETEVIDSDPEHIWHLSLGHAF